MRHVPTLLLCCATFSTATRAQQCGGTERWPVKMGADPQVSQVNLANPVQTSLHDLINLARPTLPSNNTTRLTEEKTVRVVFGRLKQFKQETGKTGDSDFHLVITDETLLSSPGGAGSVPIPHGFVAEIPNPDCVTGSSGSGPSPSRFAQQLTDVHNKFTAQFPNIHPSWNDAAGVPVKLTGVEFFDRQHNQDGRAINGVELHPLLDIEFNPTSGNVPPVTFVTVNNPGFESGNQGWTATSGVITNVAGEPAHAGQWKGWLGGYGSAHTDKLSQDVTLPASTAGISLELYLHVDTEEAGGAAYDRLRVRVRGGDQSGTLLKTLKTFSNVDAASGYVLQHFDLTPYKGQTVRISLEATEDSALQTSFVVDDVRIIVEH